MAHRDTTVTLPEPSDQVLRVTDRPPAKKLQSLVLGGSVIMLLSTTLVSIMNFAYNVVMARMLGPSRFGHVTASVTLLMLASAVTLAFQLVCAKFVARNQTAGAKAGVYRSLLGKAWLISLTLGGALFLTQKPLADYLRMPDARILAVLAIGIAAYVPLGVRRGAMQGLCSFRRLSGSFIVEAVMRLFCGAALVYAGYGVFGAVGAISASVLAAFLFPFMDPQFHVKPEKGEAASFSEGIQAIVFFVGQVIISNTDILLVKHFFAPEEADVSRKRRRQPAR
jgi:O-antigen/teichoic acid export membrane protein